MTVGRGISWSIVSSIIVAALALLSTACTNHVLTREMLQQVPPQETLKQDSMSLFLPVGNLMIPIPIGYDSNRLTRIRCLNDKGQEVYLSVNQNTQLIITDKAGETFKFYLDTVYAENNVLHGLRSRILKMKRSVSLEQIDKAELYTELSRETPVQ